MVYRNIFGSSSKVFGILRKSSEILGKCLGTFVWLSEQFWKIFGKKPERSRKSSENHQKRRHQYVYIKKEHYTLARRYEFYVLVARLISRFFAALTREILFLSLEHKIHVFSSPCNILHINNANCMCLFQCTHLAFLTFN